MGKTGSIGGPDRPAARAGGEGAARWRGFGIRAGLAGAIAALALVATPMIPTAAGARPQSYAGVKATLAKEIPAAMRASHTVGLSIALVDGRRTVWTKGFGWADKATRTPVTARTLFHIGSTSKTMTATAVMQLVEEGRVDLDAPLSRYVPKFKLRPRFPGSVITVRSVLDMHSGIPAEINNGSFSSGGPYPGYNAFLLHTLAKEYPERPVDTAYSYSNSGYELLRNLVENVSGERLDVYVRRHLFAPIGMPHTTFDDSIVPGTALAHGYRAAPGPGGKIRAQARPREYVNTWGAGSAVSSASEMASYLKTMIAGGLAPDGGRILARSTLRLMTTPQTRPPLDITSFRAGLGWWVGDRGNSWMGRAIYWDGDTANFHTFTRWLPKSHLGVFVTVNTSPTADVREAIGLRALGLMVSAKTGAKAPSPRPPAPVVAASAAKLDRAAGRYASTAGGLYTVTAEDSGLLVTPQVPLPGGDGSVLMLPRADGWYAAAKPAADNPLSALWLKPATVAGRHLMLSHSYGSAVAPAPDGTVFTFAEKVPADYRFPPQWAARTGLYRAVDMIPGTYPDVLRLGRLSVQDGVLQWNGLALEPAGPDLAFTFGFGPLVVQRGAGDALSAAGNRLTILGVTYRLVKAGE